MEREDELAYRDTLTAALFTATAFAVEELVRTSPPERRRLILREWEHTLIPRALEVAEEFPDTQYHRQGIKSAEVLLRQITRIVCDDAKGGVIIKPDTRMT